MGRNINRKRTGDPLTAPDSVDKRFLDAGFGFVEAINSYSDLTTQAEPDACDKELEKRLMLTIACVPCEEGDVSGIEKTRKELEEAVDKEELTIAYNVDAPLPSDPLEMWSNDRGNASRPAPSSVLRNPQAAAQAQAAALWRQTGLPDLPPVPNLDHATTYAIFAQTAFQPHPGQARHM